MYAPAPGPEVPVYSPSEINREVRTHLEAGFPRVWLRGEISNLARPASGHLYFSLKDAKAQIRCALFRGNAAGLSFRPVNGDQVLVRGRLSLYEPRGDYQLIADALLPAGAGELQQAFDALKKNLDAEGLFSAECKRPLPAWPRSIAVVTSPSGAAVRDIINILAQRWPLARVRIYASPVQGEAAAPGLRRALAAADRDPSTDVIILARGGGSLEDLWAFNDEQLARLIAGLATPVVSGVGHETDFTIADFVADLRAPTPTAAAVAVSPNAQELSERIRAVDRQLRRAITGRLDRLAQGLDHLARRHASQHPQRRLDETARRRNQLHRQLLRAGERTLARANMRLADLQCRLRRAAPGQTIARLEENRTLLRGRIQRAVQQRLEQYQQRLGSSARALEAVSPLNILDRGYAVVHDRRTGRVLSRASQFAPGQSMLLRFKEFQVEADVTSITGPDVSE